MSFKKILILGLGNEILSDDGIGPRLVKDLAEKNNEENIEFITSCCGGLEIMEYIRGYPRVIFIDAIRTLDGKPGNIFHFVPSDFRETSNLSNLHDVNFITALHMGEILELDLPSDLHIIAVEIIEDREFSESLTPTLERIYPEILEKVESWIRQIIGYPGNKI
jgi:hydrogenase maturation protease